MTKNFKIIKKDNSSRRGNIYAGLGMTGLAILLAGSMARRLSTPDPIESTTITGFQKGYKLKEAYRIGSDVGNVALIPGETYQITRTFENLDTISKGDTIILSGDSILTYRGKVKTMRYECDIYKGGAVYSYDTVKACIETSKHIEDTLIGRNWIYKK